MICARCGAEVVELLRGGTSVVVHCEECDNSRQALIKACKEAKNCWLVYLDLKGPDMLPESREAVKALLVQLDAALEKAKH